MCITRQRCWYDPFATAHNGNCHIAVMQVNGHLQVWHRGLLEFAVWLHTTTTMMLLSTTTGAPRAGWLVKSVTELGFLFSLDHP